MASLAVTTMWCDVCKYKNIPFNCNYKTWRSISCRHHSACQLICQTKVQHWTIVDGHTDMKDALVHFYENKCRLYAQRGISGTIYEVLQFYGSTEWKILNFAVVLSNKNFVDCTHEAGCGRRTDEHNFWGQNRKLFPRIYVHTFVCIVLNLYCDSDKYIWKQNVFSNYYYYFLIIRYVA